MRHRTGWFIALAALTADSAAAHAGLHFPQPAVDAGEVRTGTTLAHVFEFVNPGPNPITIVEARASCGCLVPQVERRTYQPGEKSALRLEINTLSQPAGPNTWTVVVRYQDAGDTRETTLRLSARLVTEILIQPAALTIFADRPITHEIRVTDLRSPSLTVTGVAASSPHLTPQLLDVSPNADGRPSRTIRVTVAAGHPDGRHDERVVIYSDDPTYREIKVPVTIVKRPRQAVSALPAEVQLAAPPGQPVPSKLVLIRAAEERAVVVDHVVADDPAFVCTWAQGPNQMATIKIQVPQTPTRNVQSAVHVHVSQPARETVTIPVGFRLQ